MHAQFFHQLALAGDAVQITNQQNAQQQQLRINRRPTRLTVAVFQLLPDELKADVLVDQTEKMVFGNLIFQAEVIEQRFGAVVLPHHEQQSSGDRNQTEHGRMLSSNMLLLNLILLIDVTFSTPTPDDSSYPHPVRYTNSENSDWRCPLRIHVLRILSFLLVCVAAVPCGAQDKVTILYDAFGESKELTKDWGYSALVEHDGKRILFDTGNDAAIFEHNVKALGVDLTKLDFVVISHRHADHTTGLRYVLKVNPNVTV